MVKNSYSQPDGKMLVDYSCDQGYDDTKFALGEKCKQVYMNIPYLYTTYDI